MLQVWWLTNFSAYRILIAPIGTNQLLKLKSMKPILLLTLVVMTTLTACRKSSVDDFAAPAQGVTLYLNLPQSPVIDTKVQSANEMFLNNLWIFVFNSSGILQAKSKASNLNNSTRTANIALPEGVGLNIFAYANMSATEEAIFNSMVIGTATLAQLKSITTDRSLLIAPGLPMWGELINTTITAASTSLSLTLTRSCSRIDVTASGVANFTFLGIEKLLKTASSAPIYPASSLVPSSNKISVVPTNKTLSSIYLYENAAIGGDDATSINNKATAMIIKGIYNGIEGYYRLLIRYNTPFNYDIGRNVIYSINITRVKSPGFATVSEAESNYPQNMDFNIIATDPDASDLTTSNGQYYIGVTNSEYTAYNSDAMNNVILTTLTHNIAASISDGTITASGTGLTLKTTTIPTSIKKLDIVADLSADFTSGTVTSRVGNIMKVITIKKKPTIGFSGNILGDYSAFAYVLGELTDPPTWFKFGKSSSVAENSQRVSNPNGGIWMHIGIFNTQPSSSRSCTAHVLSLDSKGRARLFVKQNSAFLRYVSGVPTVLLGHTNPPPFSIYVQTELPEWTIKAYQGTGNDKSKPLALTYGTKTGNPVIGTPASCSMPISIPNNTNVERSIQLYLSSTANPNNEIWFGSVVQEKAPVILTLSPASQLNIPYTGGTYTATVNCNNTLWSMNGGVGGVTVTPTIGGAGSTVIYITVAANTYASPISAELKFNSVSGDYIALASWAFSQDGNPNTPLTGSYIPLNILKSSGWPSNRLPLFGLQVATRGSKVLPGGIAAGDDPSLQTKTTTTVTSGVEQLPNTEFAPLATGKNNTDAMIAAGASIHPAAQYCRSMGPEWYLPSIGELSMIYDNQNSLGSSYKFNELNKYWSSSQDDVRFSWNVNFNGGLTFFDNQTNSERVRCVREI